MALPETVPSEPNSSVMVESRTGLTVACLPLLYWVTVQGVPTSVISVCGSKTSVWAPVVS
jgi:hypothetical protein